MKFTPISCHESLKPFIRNYWLISAECTSKGTQQIFSNGASSLQFYLTQAVRLNDGDQRYRTVLYHQSMKSVGVVSEKGPFHVFGVEFVPFCSNVFFRNGQMEEFSTPEAMQDEKFIQLSQAIHQTEDNDERARFLDEFFMQRLSEFPADDVNLERLSSVFEEMVPQSSSDGHTFSHTGEYTTADLASTACLSQKQFTRIFNKYVGMNPKAYLRLLRFHNALHELQKSASESPLMDLAWQCGYYDSSHMSADFRDICGYTPSELLKESGLTEVFESDFSGKMRKKILIENLI